MLFYVWIEIVCNKCSTTIANRYCTTQTIPRRTMKAEAKHHGWKFVDKEWYCLKCVPTKGK